MTMLVFFLMLLIASLAGMDVEAILRAMLAMAIITWPIWASILASAPPADKPTAALKAVP